MPDPRPLPPPDQGAGPSLAGRAFGWRPRLSRSTRNWILVAVAITSTAVVAGLFLRVPDATQSPQTAPARSVDMPQVEPLSATLTRLAGALPPGVRLAELTRSERLTVTIETTEPDRLRAALSRAPGMSTTRTTGEVALADGGYRVTLEQAGEAADGARTGPLPSPTSLVALARDQSLLIESVSVAGRGGIELTVSGREAGVLAFAGLVERGRPAARHARWTLTALPDGGLRLTTRIIGADRPAAAMPLPNCLLFATVAPAPVAGDAPALAGIVGRLPDDAVALVRGVDGRAVSVAPGGDAPGGWRLEALSPDAAIFTRGQERARVPLPPE